MQSRYNLPSADRPESGSDPKPKPDLAASDETTASPLQPWVDQLAPEQRLVPLTAVEARQQRDDPRSPFVAVEYQNSGDGSRAKPYRQFEVGITPEHQQARLHDVQFKIRLAEVDLDRLSERVGQQRDRVEAINQDWRAVRAQLVDLSGPERSKLLAEFHRFRRLQREARRLLGDRSAEHDQLVEQLNQLYQTRDRYQGHDYESMA